MPFTWTQEKTTALIQLWEQYPELYVVTSRDYHNKIKRVEAVKKIRGEFANLTGEEVSVEDVTKKMHGLRTQFQRERAKEMKSKTSGMSADDIYLSKLWAYPLLHFLADTAAVRESTDNLPSTSDAPMPLEVLFDGTVDELEETGESESLFTSPEPTTPNPELLEDTPSASGAKRKRGNTAVVDFLKSAKESLKQLATPIDLPPSPTKDEISTFVSSVESELRVVKNRKRIRALKAKIMNLIYTAQDEEEEEEDNN